MAETDHGEVLTRFEEIFGSVVEHEVIKLILQSCEWDAAAASDTLLGMIDKNNLPPHVLSALTADSIMRNLASRHPSSCESHANEEMGPQMPDQPINTTQRDEEGEILADDVIADIIHVMSKSPAKSTIPDSTSRTSVVTIPPSASAFHNGSPSHQTGVEGIRGTASLLDNSTTRDGESESSSPSLSPLRPCRTVAAVGSLESSASQWVLAPEFVPNAFNIKGSDVGNKNSMWLQAMSYRLMDALPISNSTSPKHQVKGGILGKKKEIIDKILNGAKIMILMRGLPGSGKSTLARELKGSNGIVLSTDDFFCDKHGKYVYEASKIGEAHQWNRHRTSQKLKQGRTPIIIDNTNLQKWEMKPYVKMALQYGYDINILDADSSWRLNPKELARKNTHEVPAKKIEEMKDRYERDVKIEDIIADLQGTGITQSSPCKNNTSKITEDITSENDPICTEVTKLGFLKTPEDLTGDTESAELINDCGEIDSIVKAEIDFDTDDDVVVEGYDEEEIQITTGDKNTTELGYEFKETISGEDERLDSDTNVLKEAENKINSQENILSENLDPPTDHIFEVLTCSTGDEKENGQEELDVSDRLVDKPTVTDAGKLESGTDAYDEMRIQNLLDEASNNIDFTKSEEEWENLTSQISGENFSDEKFNDLVMSFGSALKKHIENRDSIGIPETKDSITATETISEDVAMYDLCSTMEDKMGQSLSTLVTKLTTNDGFADIPFINSTEEGKECNSVSSNIEAQTEKLSRNLANLNLDENYANSPSSGTEESYCKLVNDQEHVTGEPSIPRKCEDEGNKEYKLILDSKNTNYPIPDEPDQHVSENTTQKLPDNDSLVAWECIDINSGLSSTNWDSKPDSAESDNVHVPKPVRTQRNRMPGDPSKWLKEPDGHSESIDDTVSSWVAVEGGTPQWDTCEPATSISEHPPSRNVLASPKYLEIEEPQFHTGAVSKFRKHKRRSASPSIVNASSPGKAGVMQIVTVYQEKTKPFYKEVETQTLSIDFEALELDHNLYELNVLYGQPHYIPVTTVSSSFSEKGPLTKGELKLEKGTMTDNPYENSVSSFQNLVAFFPNIPKDDLRDVFEKCRYDSDWAMNVLLDSGYEMSDPTDVTVRELTEVDIETDSVSETTNTDDGKNDQSSSEACDVLLDNFPDERTRKIKQSQQPEDLAKKIEIEKSFEFPESVDDRVLRLTGKQFNDLNITKVKKSKTKKLRRKENSSPSNVIKAEEVEGREGAQYITLVMDPLFASQLNMMFGPAGDCEISGDLTPEDRSVVLPLEICEMIHKYWARTVDGKFKHEAEILDSLMRQDEILARKLQEEENAAFNLSGERDDVTNDGLLEDQPVRLQEIMDLEQALQESLADKTSTEDTSISSVLNLRRLYKEYPHVDPVALKEEYTRNDSKYHITVKTLDQRYGKEQGTPKTVIAPEALCRYEQEMIERAQQNSLAEQELEISTNQHDEIVPDDPQIFRDEAQAHYHQRQEAFQKAQEASRRGMRAAAAYYAHIGNLHSEKLREANQRASQKILEVKNAHRKDANCLDLHLLHVTEAISATQAFLHERERVLFARGIRQMEVSLITGRGVHSAGGQAVLKPVIREHLQKNGYSFYEANSGMLKVTLRAKSS